MEFFYFDCFDFCVFSLRERLVQRSQHQLVMSNRTQIGRVQFQCVQCFFSSSSSLFSSLLIWIITQSIDALSYCMANEKKRET